MHPVVQQHVAEVEALKCATHDRLLKGTIARILRGQLASGWNKWVDSYHAERLAAGLSAQSDAHKEALEEMQKAHAEALEQSVVATEAEQKLRLAELEELRARLEATSAAHAAAEESAASKVGELSSASDELAAAAMWLRFAATCGCKGVVGCGRSNA